MALIMSPRVVGKDPVSEGDNTFDCARLAFEGGCYSVVAEVDGDDLEAVFRKTQNGETAWSENPPIDVVPVGHGPFRGTSIGDIVERDGRFMIVSHVGFQELEEFTPPRPAAREVKIA